MTWTEQLSTDSSIATVSLERAKLFDMAKDSSLPVIQREGDKPFDVIKFQPVRSPGIYEAEFGVRGEDLIFHFWPYGYRLAESSGKAVPHFKKPFTTVLDVEMKKSFGTNRVELVEDKDMGSWFVKAKGWGVNQFYRELAIKVCENIHKNMGGSDS